MPVPFPPADAHEFQKVMHAKIAGGLQFWMQNSIQPALESEC